MLRFLCSIPGLIFVVDSADPDRFEEASDELFRIISEAHMSRIPLLILAAKQDLPRASSPEVIIREMRLRELPHYQAWTITACSAKNGEGITKGLEKFSALLEKSLE